MSTDPSTSEKLKRLRKAPPPMRRVVVRSMEDLTPHLRRVVLGGDELDGFSIPSAASSVRLLVPPAVGHGGVEPTMPTWTGNQFEMPDGDRAPIRTFTPRYFDAERRELSIDVVLHEHGAASDWARAASVGDVTAVSGPGRAETFPDGATSFLLAGDESAVPAIAQLLETLDPAASIEVHVEVSHPDARLDLPEHPGARVTWHDTPADGPPGAAFAAAVEAVDELPDAVWVAGEAAAVQRLRTHLFDHRGRARSTVTARGYWKSGRSAS